MQQVQFTSAQSTLNCRRSVVVSPQIPASTIPVRLLSSRLRKVKDAKLARSTGTVPVRALLLSPRRASDDALDSPPAIEAGA